MRQRTKQEKLVIMKAIDDFDECRTGYLRMICEELEKKMHAGTADELEKKMFLGTSEELMMTGRALNKMRQWLEEQ